MPTPSAARDPRRRASIGRYPNPYLAVEWRGGPPAGTRCEPFQLETIDRAVTTGSLYTRGGEDTVVAFMHPRADFARHYAVPGLVAAGFAVFCQNSRWLGNDANLEHERLVFDVAAGLAALRARYGRIVLCGNSGGGSLYTLYVDQALASPEERLADSAAGAPIDLRQVELPVPDAMVYLAAHVGEGFFLEHAIDPSVSEEGDPLSCEPGLDAYDEANGFSEPPATSRYEPDFLERYRVAQRARVERLDALARARIEARRAARAAWKETGSLRDRRRSIATDYLVVYRTDADPRCVDLALDPSDRDYGSLWGRRPDWFNYGAVGFGRVVSPEAWLSTWSGRSSRANIQRTGARMTLPCLQVSYEADNGIFPEDDEIIARSLGTRQLERARIPGDHYGLSGPEGESTDGRDAAIETIVSWLRG